jgi:N-glycosylase/DNA lyase
VIGADAQPVALDWAALWEEFGSFYIERVTAFADTSSPNIEDELLFCLLGGHGVTFELARSAATVLEPLKIFGPEWETTALEAAMRAELEKPQFEPRRRDGSLRRYRYPRRKAQLIAEAAEWVDRRGPLAESLVALADERARRDLLCDCPGVGLKTASWVLRNVGMGDGLAVIDIHVLRALAAAGRIHEVRLPRDYDAIEGCFLAWCDELNAPPAAFDLMLWEGQREL